MKKAGEKIVRVTLEQEITRKLQQMIDKLKVEGKHVKITPNSLVHWILERYSSYYFEKDKSMIIKTHFSSKEYLKEILVKLDDKSKAEDVLKDALEKLKQNTDTKRKTRTKSSLEQFTIGAKK